MSSLRFFVTINPLRYPSVHALYEKTPRKVATTRLLDACEKLLELRARHGEVVDAWLAMLASGQPMPAPGIGGMLAASQSAATGHGSSAAGVSESNSNAAADSAMDDVMAGLRPIGAGVASDRSS
jgi:hypothetical protein